jgi:hypothetical protein
MPSPFLPPLFDNVGPVAIMFGKNLKPPLDLRRIMETSHALMPTLFGKRWQVRRGQINTTSHSKITATGGNILDNNKSVVFKAL